jgi:hypothetical protein
LGPFSILGTYSLLISIWFVWFGSNNASQLKESLIDGTSLVVLLCQSLMMNSSLRFWDPFLVFSGLFWGFDWNPLLQYLPRGAAVSGLHVKLSDFSCPFFCPCFDVW